MKPSERAAEIAQILTEDPSITKVVNSVPTATEIPIDAQMQSFLLMINLYIDASFISIPVLWEMTVPVIRRLSNSNKLKEFKTVAIQICGSRKGQASERIIRVSSLVNCVEQLIANEPGHLLNDGIWKGDSFECAWYWDKEKIRR